MTKSRSNAVAPAAKGQLVVGTGTDASTTLAVASTAGYVLTVDSAETTGLKWAAAAAGSTFAGVQVYNTAAVSAANGADTYVTYSTEHFDSDSYHSTSTNTSRLTVPSGKNGKYFIYCNLNFDPNSTGYRSIVFSINRTTEVGRVQVGAGAVSGTNGTAMATSIAYDLAVGDYVEVMVNQNSGGALNVSSNSNYVFGMFKIG